MEPSYAVRFIWTMAGYEAQLGRHLYIEPEHLVLAMLKFSELSETELKNVIQDGDMQNEIIGEQIRLKTFFRQYKISSPEKWKKIRYRLREDMGKGECNDRGRKIIHRSLQTKKIFSAAEHSAAIGNATSYSSIDLLQEIFNNPTPKILNLIRRFDITKINDAISTVYLQKYGKELSKKSSSAGMKSAGEPDPILTVMHHSLRNGPNRNILLISTGPRNPSSVMEDFIEYSGNIQEEEEFRFIQVDINHPLLSHDREGSGEDPEFVLNSLLDEASKIENVILFLNNFDQWFDKQFSKALLEQRLKDKSVRCVAGIDGTRYLELIPGQKTWNRLFHHIWIHENPLQDN